MSLTSYYDGYDEFGPYGYTARFPEFDGYPDDDYLPDWREDVYFPGEYDPDDVEAETLKMWEDYEAQRDAAAILEAPVMKYLTSAEVLEQKLHRMQWTLPPTTGRRPSHVRTTRHGGRYRVRQKHGTAASRDGIEQMHQHRAELHAHGLHWPLARTERTAFRNLRDDYATWGPELDEQFASFTPAWNVFGPDDADEDSPEDEPEQGNAFFASLGFDLFDDDYLI